MRDLSVNGNQKEHDKLTFNVIVFLSTISFKIIPLSFLNCKTNISEQVCVA
jgi:hypothetical protein